MHLNKGRFALQLITKYTSNSKILNPEQNRQQKTQKSKHRTLETLSRSTIDFVVRTLLTKLKHSCREAFPEYIFAAGTVKPVLYL